MRSSGIPYAWANTHNARSTRGLGATTRFAATICSIRSARTLASASRSASRSRSSRIACFSASSESKRSEEHTSELQSRSDIVCRLLLEKKKCSELRWAYCNHKATYFASYLTGGDCVPDDQN